MTLSDYEVPVSVSHDRWEIHTQYEIDGHGFAWAMAKPKERYNPVSYLFSLEEGFGGRFVFYKDFVLSVFEYNLPSQSKAILKRIHQYIEATYGRA